MRVASAKEKGEAGGLGIAGRIKRFYSTDRFLS